MTQREEAVGLGEIKVGQGDGVLVCYGLGSCVAVALYDPKTKVGGLAHVVLPRGGDDQREDAKYADTGIPNLLKRVLELGAGRRNVVAKLTGGAQVLGVPIFQQAGEVGQRNIRQVTETLGALGIPIIREEVGGNTGRTAKFYIEDGRVVISRLGGNLQTI